MALGEDLCDQTRRRWEKQTAVVEKYTQQTSYQLAVLPNTPSPGLHTKGASAAWGRKSQALYVCASALTWNYGVPSVRFRRLFWIARKLTTFFSSCQFMKLVAHLR